MQQQNDFTFRSWQRISKLLLLTLLKAALMSHSKARSKDLRGDDIEQEAWSQSSLQKKGLYPFPNSIPKKLVLKELFIKIWFSFSTFFEALLYKIKSPTFETESRTLRIIHIIHLIIRERIKFRESDSSFTFVERENNLLWIKEGIE